MLARRDNVYTPGVIKEIQMNRHVGIQQDEDKQTVYYRDVIETRYLLRETLYDPFFVNGTFDLFNVLNVIKWER